MFSFFRQIRHRLFQEGKASRYIGYAIGEIVLIVVGILIAVQIGEWNEKQADRHLEQSYIEQLILNIEIDIRRCEAQVAINELRVHLVDILVQAAKDPDSVRGHTVEFLEGIAHTTSPSEEPVSSSTFDELKSTGYLRLLDPDLKKELFEYYRREGRMRQFEFEHKEVGFEFRKRRKGILTLEQERWVEDEIGSPVLPRGYEEVLALEYPEDSAVEAAIRLQENEPFVAWLPEVLKDLNLVNRRHNQRIRNATELLEALKAELAN